ncbi:MAG: nucleotidyl transferase AbiEii/AbiGii toxin family protein, partial [Spirochaetia bacterium]|nr:nucleotidyl transferase AbiEii/AbiGii toxin family protein [Spirochaetia bacterium]
FLFRLGKSTFRGSYVLKGAYLLTIVLEDQTYRTTKDIDFLKTGKTDTDSIRESLESICTIQYPEDAVVFDIASISLQDIREQNVYHGQRAKLRATIGKARVILQIDIGHGDSVFPDPVTKEIPSLLPMDAPHIESYPIETVIAEKLEAAVYLSLLTSRMKDFYDLYIITMAFSLDYRDLQNAVQQTFHRRNTALPTEMPIVFSEQVYQDETKQTQWKAFTRKLRNEHSALPLEKVIKQISRFSAPFWTRTDPGPMTWNPDSGWL